MVHWSRWAAGVVLAAGSVASTGVAEGDVGDLEPLFEPIVLMSAANPAAAELAPSELTRAVDLGDDFVWPAVSAPSPAAPSARVSVTLAGWPVACTAVDLMYVDAATELVDMWGTVELVQGSAEVDVTYPSTPGRYVLRAGGSEPVCSSVAEDDFYVQERIFELDVRDPVAGADVGLQASGWPTACTSLELQISGEDGVEHPWAEVPLTDGSGQATAAAPTVAGRYHYTIGGVDEDCGASRERELSVLERALRVATASLRPVPSPTELTVAVEGWPDECASLGLSSSISTEEDAADSRDLGEIELDQGWGEAVIPISDAPGRYYLWAVGSGASCGDPARVQFTIDAYVDARWNVPSDAECEEGCDEDSMRIYLRSWPTACRALDLRVTPVDAPDGLTGRVGMPGTGRANVEIPLSDLGGLRSVGWIIEVSGSPDDCGSAPPVALESLRAYSTYLSTGPGSLSAHFDATGTEIVVEAAGWYVNCPYLRLSWYDDVEATTIMQLTDGAGTIRVPAPDRSLVVFEVSWADRCVGSELAGPPPLELIAERPPPNTTAPDTTTPETTTPPEVTLPATGARSSGSVPVVALLAVVAGAVMLQLARRPARGRRLRSARPEPGAP